MTKNLNITEANLPEPNLPNPTSQPQAQSSNQTKGIKDNF
jgi:hypothetical protein